MFEIIADAIAFFVYHSIDPAVRIKKVNITKLFSYSLVFMLILNVVITLVYQNVSLNSILLKLSTSVVAAALVTFLAYSAQKNCTPQI